MNRFKSAILIEFLLALLVTFILVLWRRMTPSDLLFDQFCIISILLFVLSFLRNKWVDERNSRKKTNEHAIAVALISSLIYFSTIQYTVLAVDRSRSFYVLSWVEKGWFNYAGASLNLDPTVVRGDIDLDTDNLEPIQQRIDEQISRRLIEIKGEKIQLTPIGELFLSTSNLTATLFNLKNWKTNTDNRVTSL